MPHGRSAEVPKVNPEMNYKSHAVIVDGEALQARLGRMVRTPSINPLFDATSPGEVAMAALVEGDAEALGMTITRREPQAGRVSVLSRLPGQGRGRTLLLYAHHDTVGVTGMPEPFSAAVRDGRMYGRGSYDMKCGLAAAFAAVAAIRSAGITLAGDLLIAAVADEEAASIGITDLLTVIRADGAIVTEPTELQLCVAHKGFAWIEVTTIGRAAHGSRYQDGIDANMRMGRVLTRLEQLERRLRAAPPHRLLGPPSLHAGVIEGGTGASTYAASCTVQLEWRMLPHETAASVLAEVEQILAALRAEDPTFQANATLTLVRPPFEVPADASIVAIVRDAATAVLGAPPAAVGAPFWMDASLIAAAGIPVVVFGPSGDGAHAVEEWVDLESVRQTAEVLARSAIAFCGVADPGQ
jgi:acetylornithine deacetylase